jgi:MFS family permease
MSETERIRITHDDVYSPKVDEVLAREGSFGMGARQMMAGMGGQEEGQRSGLVRFLYSSVFYTAVAGALGSCIGWGLIEPFFDDQVASEATGFFANIGGILLWPIIAGLTGLFVGSAEGVVGRNWSRAVISGLIGVGIAFGGALVLTFVSGILYQIVLLLVIRVGEPEFSGPQGYFTADDCNKVGYVVWTIGRAVAWAPMGIVVGLGSAVHLRSRKLAFNGIVGGLLGAFLGGLLFNPLASLFSADDAWVSRGFGFTAIGLGAGVMIGLVENLAKTAWLHVQAGSLAGKQFIIYKSPTVIGSSPKCEIYLFKDEAIEPKHAAIHAYGNRHELEDLDSPAGTFVNGRRVTRQPLKNGDRIYIGETVLDFSEKEND